MNSFDNPQYRTSMNIVIVGHVDHGKSTVIGRLLADTGSLPEGKLQQIKNVCSRNSRSFEYAFLLDALKDEQSQGITIDSARVFFNTNKRDYIIIDAPGHLEFLKNMVSGASRAKAALLVIDANEGIKENSKRHGYMLSMLGIKQVCVLVNKMDLVGYREDVFNSIKIEYTSFLSEIGIYAESFIPVSGRNGDNIASNSNKMHWHKGNTVIDVLDSFKSSQSSDKSPFRMHVQDVYKFTNNGDDRRIIAGTISSGKIHPEDEIVFYPDEKITSINRIESFNSSNPKSASSGNAVGFTLKQQIYVQRGHLACLKVERPPHISNRFRCNVFWLGKRPLVKNKVYTLKIGTFKTAIQIEKIIRVIDSSTLNSKASPSINKHDVCELIISAQKPVAFDLASELDETSRFVIVDDYEISGGGIIAEPLKAKTISCQNESQMQNNNSNIFWQNSKINYNSRCKNLNQKGMVVWFTGLSASGKTTLSTEVEKLLHDMGFATYSLDGDNVRHGLSSDLGFTAEERNENLRRVSEICALFKDAGLITLASFISPFEKARRFAREKSGNECFLEVYVKADIDTCIRRDPKGLYEKAQKGIIDDFTGISSPYEEPSSPDLVIDTTKDSILESALKILDEILKKQ